MAQSPDAAELTVGVDAVPTVLAGAALHNLRFRIFEPQGQPPTTQDNRAWRSLLSTSAVRAGPVVYRRRLSTPCVRTSRIVRGPCGPRWAWWTVRLVFDDGHRCLDGAGGGKQALWVNDPQHPADCLTGHYCPGYAGARAADGDPVQRRETLGSKEIQAAQIQDQPAATHQMPQRVLGHSVSVGCVNVAVGADDGYRRPQPTIG